MNTKEVRNKVRKRLRKSVYFGKRRVTAKRKVGDNKVAALTGKRKAGDDEVAAVVVTSKFIPNDKIACIECNQPSNH